MSQYLRVHPTHPQGRLVNRAAEIVRDGGVIVYPTDSTYAIGCHLGDKDAVDRIRAIRRLQPDHNFTLMCRDLSELATYARVDNASYRVIRRYLPGPFTFVLPATREVPRRLVHRRRRTIGLRVPGHPIAQALLGALSEPMMSTTLLLPDEDMPVTDVEDRRPRTRTRGRRDRGRRRWRAAANDGGGPDQRRGRRSPAGRRGAVRNANGNQRG